MDLISYAAQVSGLSRQTVLPLIAVEQDATGKQWYTRWAVPNIAEPTDDQVAAALAAPMPVALLAAALINAAQKSSGAITDAIASTKTHLAGYASFANMARAPSANNGVPTNSIDLAAFKAAASALGLTTAAFATVVLAMDGASGQNLAILLALEASAATAKSASDLATALSTFQAALAAFVAQLNAVGLTTTVPAPTTITIVGINA